MFNQPVSCFSTNFDMMERSDVNVVAFSSSTTGTATNAIKLIPAIEPGIIQMHIIIIKRIGRLNDAFVI